MSSKNSREQAETAFGDLQSQFFARGNATEEIEHVTRIRDENTCRLREATLAHEEQERLAATVKPSPRQRKRS